MSSATIERLDGLAALAGGMLITITAIVGLAALDYENFDETARTGTYTLTAVLYLLAVILVLGGVVGLYTSQVQAVGYLEVFGFLLVFFGTALMAGAAWFEAFAARTLALAVSGFFADDPGGWLGGGRASSYILAALGWLLFGVATLRAGVYPRLAAILLIVGAVLLGLPVPGTEIVLAVTIAMAWMSGAPGLSAAGLRRRGERPCPR
jgi:hypothetical protein